MGLLQVLLTHVFRLQPKDSSNNIYSSIKHNLVWMRLSDWDRLMEKELLETTFCQAEISCGDKAMSHSQGQERKSNVAGSAAAHSAAILSEEPFRQLTINLHETSWLASEKVWLIDCKKILPSHVLTKWRDDNRMANPPSLVQSLSFSFECSLFGTDFHCSQFL